jgi:hypothetical protein
MISICEIHDYQQTIYIIDFVFLCNATLQFFVALYFFMSFYKMK